MFNFNSRAVINNSFSSKKVVQQFLEESKRLRYELRFAKYQSSRGFEITWSQGHLTITFKIISYSTFVYIFCLKSSNMWGFFFRSWPIRSLRFCLKMYSEKHFSLKIVWRIKQMSEERLTDFHKNEKNWKKIRTKHIFQAIGFYFRGDFWPIFGHDVKKNPQIKS